MFLPNASAVAARWCLEGQRRLDLLELQLLGLCLLLFLVFIAVVHALAVENSTVSVRRASSHDVGVGGECLLTSSLGIVHALAHTHTHTHTCLVCPQQCLCGLMRARKCVRHTVRGTRPIAYSAVFGPGATGGLGQSVAQCGLSESAGQFPAERRHCHVWHSSLRARAAHHAHSVGGQRYRLARDVARGACGRAARYSIQLQYQPRNFV